MKIRTKNKPLIEIKSKLNPDVILAVVYKKHRIKRRVNLSPENHILQTSIVVINKLEPVLPHKHSLLRRETYGTFETWVILNGKGFVRFYDIDDTIVHECRVSMGDVIVNFHVGHSLAPKTKHLTLVEVKNGPYWGVELDKISVPN